MLTAVISIILSIFAPPMNDFISLAGNFGEPRPHHFHGGLDVKTEGREGKHVYAIGDGYVSRVTMGLYGFGNAVYITHPSGQTSVYCHLKSFSPRIKAALRRYQYLHETSVADARLTPLDVPVSQGQFIALSGNSGHSTAPHLHLELHDTRTWDMLDPYPFLSDHIADSVAPQAHGLMAVPQAGQGTFNGSCRKQTFGIGGHHIDRQFTAWGRIGFALWADDYMQGSYNHYGVRQTVLTVDGREVFRSVVDRIPMRLNRLVNSWGDYDHWLHYRTWYLKSFVEPGNTLPMLQADRERGIVSFDEQRDYHLEYILSDYHGNEARYTFTVRGERPVPTAESASTAPSRTFTCLRWNQTNTYGVPGMQMVVPYGLLATDVELSPVVKRQPYALSDVYTFMSQSCPLAADGEISIFVRQENIVAEPALQRVVDPEKLYVTCDGRYAGGSYAKGWVTGRLRDLGGSYAVAYDNCPPLIRPISLTGGRLLFSVTDGQSGVASWRGDVDGRFVVFDAVDKSSNMVCHLDESPVSRTGKTHHLRLLATDRCNNTAAYEAEIVY